MRPDLLDRSLNVKVRFGLRGFMIFFKQRKTSRIQQALAG
jgi:hypothetical protein